MSASSWRWYPKPELDRTPWSFHHQINLTFDRRSRRLHQYPACGGSRLKRTKPFFNPAFWAPVFCGSSAWIGQN
jgi:hypothetical protein